MTIFDHLPRFRPISFQSSADRRSIEGMDDRPPESVPWNTFSLPQTILREKCSSEQIEDRQMYRFGQVAAAVGLGEPALRNWLRRNKIDLFEAQPETGWRTFTRNDVFVLAVAAEMVRYGAPVRDAVDAARTGLGSVNFKTFEGLPNCLFAAETRFGRWQAVEDEALLSGMAVSPTLVKIAVPIVFNNARKRLEASA